jgi:hypothetical protein
MHKQAVSVVALIWNKDVRSFKVDRIYRQIVDEFVDPDFLAGFGHCSFEFLFVEDHEFAFGNLIAFHGVFPRNDFVISGADPLVFQWLTVLFMQESEGESLVVNHRVQFDGDVYQSDSYVS